MTCKVCGHHRSVHTYSHIPNPRCTSPGCSCKLTDQQVDAGFTAPPVSAPELDDRLTSVEEKLDEILTLLREQKMEKWAKENL